MEGTLKLLEHNKLLSATTNFNLGCSPKRFGLLDFGGLDWFWAYLYAF